MDIAEQSYAGNLDMTIRTQQVRDLIDFTITPCVERKHMTGSLHYAGAAIDVRTRDLQPADVQKLIARIESCLGDDFDVLLEVDHIHIEFQPKVSLTP